MTMRTPLFHNEEKDTSLRELFYGSQDKEVTHFMKKRLLMNWACPLQLGEGTYVRRKPKLILTSGFMKNARDKHQLVTRRQTQKAPSKRAVQPDRKARVVDESLGASLTAFENQADVSRVDPESFSWSNAGSQMTYQDCQDEAEHCKMTTTYLSCVVQCPAEAGAAYRQRRAQLHQGGPDPKRTRQDILRGGSKLSAPLMSIPETSEVRDENSGVATGDAPSVDVSRPSSATADTEAVRVHGPPSGRSSSSHEMQEDSGRSVDPLFRTVRRNVAKYTSFVMLARDLMVPHPFADPDQLIIPRPIFVDQKSFTNVRAIYETLFDLQWPYTSPKKLEPFKGKRVWDLIWKIPQLYADPSEAESASAHGVPSVAAVSSPSGLTSQVRGAPPSAQLAVPQVVIPAAAVLSVQADPLGIGSVQDSGVVPSVVAPMEVHSTYLPTTEAAKFDIGCVPSVAAPEQHQEARDTTPPSAPTSPVTPGEASVPEYVELLSAEEELTPDIREIIAVFQRCSASNGPETNFVGLRMERLQMFTPREEGDMRPRGFSLSWPDELMSLQVQYCRIVPMDRRPLVLEIPATCPWKYGIRWTDVAMVYLEAFTALVEPAIREERSCMHLNSWLSKYALAMPVTECSLKQERAMDLVKFHQLVEECMRYHVPLLAMHKGCHGSHIRIMKVTQQYLVAGFRYVHALGSAEARKCLSHIGGTLADWLLTELLVRAGYPPRSGEMDDEGRAIGYHVIHNRTYALLNAYLMASPVMQGTSFEGLNYETIGDYYEASVGMFAFQGRFDVIMDIVLAAMMVEWSEPSKAYRGLGYHPGDTTVPAPAQDSTADLTNLMILKILQVAIQHRNMRPSPQNAVVPLFCSTSDNRDHMRVRAADFLAEPTLPEGEVIIIDGSEAGDDDQQSENAEDVPSVAAPGSDLLQGVPSVATLSTQP
jgi:hypothetical protein